MIGHLFAAGRPAIVVYGGAGRSDPDTSTAREAGCRRACERGVAILAAGGSAIDAVTAAVAGLEDDPLFNAGIGSVLTAAGTVEMDASVMDGCGRAGAVTLVCSAVNPVRLARAVMEDGRHVFLGGAATDAFARERLLPCRPNEWFVTADQLRRWQRSRPVTGTVGAVAVDRERRVAAATSTGGKSGKLCGRIGDTPVIGAGTFADDAAGAASATGDGEAILCKGLARRAVDLLRGGMHPSLAAKRAIRELSAARGEAGLIVIDPFGRIGIAFNTTEMCVCWQSAGDVRSSPMRCT